MQVADVPPLIRNMPTDRLLGQLGMGHGGPSAAWYAACEAEALVRLSALFEEAEADREELEARADFACADADRAIERIGELARVASATWRGISGAVELLANHGPDPRADIQTAIGSLSRTMADLLEALHTRGYWPDHEKPAPGAESDQ